MRRTTLLIAAALVGCAPASSSIVPRPEPPARIEATSTGVEVRLDADERVVGGVVPRSADDAWDALVALYGQLGFPIEVRDPNRRAIATEIFRAPRRILDRRLRSYMDCGQTLTGARVDMWRVSARLMTELEPTGDGTTVRSRLTASARPRDGSSTPPVPCTSSGELEREIVQRVHDGSGAR